MFNIGAFISYAFVVSFSPGPNNIMCMANASKSGYKYTLKFILGITSGFFVLMLFSSYFNLILFKYLPKIKFVMSIIGATYMTYLALKVAGIQLPKKAGSKGKIQSDNKSINSFKTGFVLQFVNPKAVLYGLTIVANFVIPYYNTHVYLLVFSILLASIAFASTSSWALFGTLFNKFLNQYERPFNFLMSGLLLYSALSILGIV